MSRRRKMSRKFKADQYGIESRADFQQGMARVRAYQRVLSTNPAVPVILDFRRWAGRPILFRDAECTQPVEAEGDPIGGGRHPITGEIIFTQPISAERPVWTEEGAAFDTATSLLVGDASTLNFIHETWTFSSITKLLPEIETTENVLRNIASLGSSRGMRWRLDGSGNITNDFSITDGSWQRHTSPADWLSYDSAFTYSQASTEGAVTYSMDGVPVDNRSITIDTELGDAPGPLLVGGGYEGMIGFVAFYDRGLSPATIARISELLA